MKNKFYKRIGLLGLCLIVGKILGAAYRIPLTSVLGSEGMGLYQTVFPLYTLLLTASSGGVSVAVARAIASESDTEGERVVKVALKFFLFLGLLFSFAIIIFAKRIAAFQGNESAYLGYIAIAPAITFVSTISVLRGYYQGKERVLPSALSQLIEQAVKLAVGLLLSRIFIEKGAQWGAFGALVGVSVSELIALAFMIATYHVKSKNTKVCTPRFYEFSTEIAQFSGVKIARDSQIIKKLITVAFPVTIGSLILPLTAFFDSITIVNVLTPIVGESVAIKSYGVYTGAVNTLVNLPVVLLSALSIPLLPIVVKRGKDSRKTIIKSAILSMAVGLCCSLFFIFFGALPIRILYRSLGEMMGEAVKLLKISGASIFPLSIITVCTTALQGLNKAKIPALNLFFGAAVKAVISIIALKVWGIYGAAVGSLCCYMVAATLDVFALMRALYAEKENNKIAIKSA